MCVDCVVCECDVVFRDGVWMIGLCVWLLKCIVCVRVSEGVIECGGLSELMVMM